MSEPANRLLEKLQSNDNRKKGKKTITISSLMENRTNLRSSDRVINAIRELQSEGLIELKEARVEGRFERELIIVPKEIEVP